MLDSNGQLILDSICNYTPKTVDYSKGTTADECMLKYDFAHNKGWATINGSTALRFGSAFHAGMEGFYNHVKKCGWVRDGNALTAMLTSAEKKFEEESEGRLFYDDYRTFKNLVIVLTRYIDYFANDEGFLKVLNTERAFKLLMKPTKEDKRNYPWIKPFYFTGKLDMECELSGAKWINEFKTTGWQMNTLKNQLARSPQIIGYNYASRKCFDVIPEGNLVTIAYCTSRRVKAGGYGKLTTDFARVPIVYSDADLTQWREHFITIAAKIQFYEKQNYYPPNLKSCYNFGKCKYINICEQNLSNDLDHYPGYIKEIPWDVTKSISSDSKVIEGEE
ncbi:MAG: PD-(D/E)XK nuclease family protein [Candidatus Heimdallarchaeaceae archaeon]